MLHLQSALPASGVFEVRLVVLSDYSECMPIFCVLVPSLLSVETFWWCPIILLWLKNFGLVICSPSPSWLPFFSPFNVCEVSGRCFLVRRKVPVQPSTAYFVFGAYFFLAVLLLWPFPVDVDRFRAYVFPDTPPASLRSLASTGFFLPVPRCFFFDKVRPAPLFLLTPPSGWWLFFDADVLLSLSPSRHLFSFFFLI